MGSEKDIPMLEYNQELNDFSGLYQFATTLVLPEFMNLKVEVEEANYENVSELNQALFEQTCQGMCVVALFDGKPSTERMEILQKVQAISKAKHLPVSFGWVDAQCQHELKKSVQAAKFPFVFVAKGGRAFEMKGDYRFESFDSFLRLALIGRPITFNFDGKFVNRNCKKERIEDL